MTRDLHPSDGARYLLERAAATGERDARARYRATIFVPGADFTADVTLGTDGAVELADTGAPAELHARLLSIVRLVARDAGKLAADGMPAWPARILRWRR
ncbi:MAG TPA: hypothetical protein VFP84_01100 [Kofleriaceae bacterium]|nr:hypothetical protein [Kofleriaceae bacterium]